MAKHIVFTGPDGSGKSSHLQRIAQILSGSKYKVITNRAIRYDKKYNEQLPKIIYNLLEYVKDDVRSDTYVFHDRWNYPEEVIYPRVMGNVVTPVAKHAAAIELQINEMKDRVYFVVFNAPPTVLTERLSDRGGENYIELHHLQGLHNEYKAFVENTTIQNVIEIYDDGKKGFDLLNRNLMDALVEKGVFK